MSEGVAGRLDIAAIIELLERVEELPDGATGSLMIQGGDSPGGAILVDDRQVCWIAANGMGRRLSDLLRAQATRSLSTAELEDIVASCRETKEPIGQALLARGLITEVALVRALKRHSTESLIALAQGSPAVTWVPRERGFAPRHRLSTATLLAEVGATARWGGIAPSLGWLHECGARGAAYARALGQQDGLLTPVAEIGMTELGARGLLELGSWTATTIEAVRRVEPEVPCAIFDDGRGHRCVGWHRGVLLHVAVCDDDIALSRVVRRVYAT
ncbi:MAG: hypothetical protein K8W52_34375 [Deltaproteobacteria bacterium]|nr:hypothetical protein [Deltaproteobacteria bacterium]